MIPENPQGSCSDLTFSLCFSSISTWDRLSYHVFVHANEVSCQCCCLGFHALHPCVRVCSFKHLFAEGLEGVFTVRRPPHQQLNVYTGLRFDSLTSQTAVGSGVSPPVRLRPSAACMLVIPGGCSTLPAAPDA